MDLLSKMVVGWPHFVRCIKPNDDRQALGSCKGEGDGAAALCWGPGDSEHPPPGILPPHPVWKVC